jgi:hypothetical protein
MQRDAHAKSVACVKATFRTLGKGEMSDSSHAATQGLFAPGQSYDAIVRFSNSNLVVTANDDNTPDARGISVKLIGAAGSSPTIVTNGHLSGNNYNVDLTAVNVPTFVTANLYDYVHFVQGGRMKETIFQNVKIPLTLLRYAPTLFSNRSMLADTYFSIGAYGFGEGRVVKWAFKSQQSGLPAVSNRKDPNSRRSNIQDVLRQRSVKFDFIVQDFVNEKDTPIEDYSVEWSERKAPFHNVGVLEIPKIGATEDIADPERMVLCDHLSFNAWRTTENYRPLGNLHRARRVLYSHMAKIRHRANSIDYAEPKTSSLP